MNPRTEAGRRLLREWGEQTCCGFPHGPHSGDGVYPPHERTSEHRSNLDIVLACEAEAAQLDPVKLAEAMDMRIVSSDLDPTYRRPTAEEVAAEYNRLLGSQPPADTKEGE